MERTDNELEHALWANKKRSFFRNVSVSFSTEHLRLEELVDQIRTGMLKHWLILIPLLPHGEIVQLTSEIPLIVMLICYCIGNLGYSIYIVISPPPPLSPFNVCSKSLFKITTFVELLTTFVESRNTKAWRTCEQCIHHWITQTPQHTVSIGRVNKTACTCVSMHTFSKSR